MIIDIILAIAIILSIPFVIKGILRIIDRVFPGIVESAFVALFLPVITDIAAGIGNSILETLEDAERAYPIWVYGNYKKFRMKKQLGLIWKDEQFIWTDKQEDEQFRLAFLRATTPGE